jgi:hypothetical protein
VLSPKILTDDRVPVQAPSQARTPRHYGEYPLGLAGSGAVPPQASGFGRRTGQADERAGLESAPSQPAEQSCGGTGQLNTMRLDLSGSGTYILTENP